MSPRVCLALLPALVLGGCEARNCQNTCQRVYGDSECQISLDGVTTDDAIDDCVRECEGALKVTGDLCVEIGGETDCYDPNVKRPSNLETPLVNEKRAAAWMDCVWDRAPGQGKVPGCDDLDPRVGYCQPI